MDTSYLLGAQGINLPNPLDIAKQGMSLADLAQQVGIRNYALRAAQRQDAATQALGQILPQLQASGFSDQAVQQAMQHPLIQQYPELANSILTAVEARRKSDIDVQKAQAETLKASAEGKKIAFDHIGSAAYAEGQNPDPNSLNRINSLATFYKVPLPPFNGDPNDPGTVSTYLKGLSSAALSIKDQLENAEKYRHNIETERQARETAAQTRAYQTGELGVRGQELILKQKEADPFGIYGINPGNAPPTGAPSGAPSGTMAAPTGGTPPTFPGTTIGTAGALLDPATRGPTMAANDQVRLGQLQDELARETAAGRTDSVNAITSEIQRIQGQQPQGAAAGPATLALGPAAMGPGGIVGDAMRQGLHGDEFLAKLPDPIAANVKAIIEGREPIVGRAGMTPKMKEQLIMLAAQYEPGFDATTFAARQKARQSFASGGINDLRAQAISQGMEHMGRLYDNLGALSNFGGMATPLNRIINPVEQFFGDPRQTAVATDVQAVSNEVAKIFRQTGMAEAEIKDWQNKFPVNGSPEQQQAAMNEAVRLIEGRVNAMQNSWRESMGPNIPMPNILSPEAQAAWQKITSGAAPAAAVRKGAAKSGTTQPRVFNSEAEAESSGYKGPAIINGRKAVIQ